MKILLLAPHPFFQNRGTPIAVRALAEVLGEAGHRVDLLAYAEGDDVVLPGVRLLRIPRLPGLSGIRPGFSFKKLVADGLMAASILPLVHRQRYDLVHAVEESAYLARALKAVYRIPYVYDMDSSLAQQLTERLPRLRPAMTILAACERLALRHAAAVVPVCEALAAVAQRGHARKVVLLPDVSLLDGATDGLGRPAGDRHAV